MTDHKEPAAALPEPDVIAYSCVGDNDAYSENALRAYGKQQREAGRQEAQKEKRGPDERHEHPNLNVPVDTECSAKLDDLGDDRGQGLDGYWKWGFRAGWHYAKKSTSKASAVPEDPMDTPLPCDVKVGHGTIRKGCKLRTLVTRMQVLYDMVQKYVPPFPPQAEEEPAAHAANCATRLESSMRGPCDCGIAPERIQQSIPPFGQYDAIPRFSFDGETYWREDHAKQIAEELRTRAEAAEAQLAAINKWLDESDIPPAATNNERPTLSRIELLIRLKHSPE